MDHRTPGVHCHLPLTSLTIVRTKNTPYSHAPLSILLLLSSLNDFNSLNSHPDSTA